MSGKSNRLVIRNGKIVNADGIFEGDIYIEDGIIKELGKDLQIPGGTKSINVNGNYVFPGGIDPHTNMESTINGPKTIDDFHQGTKAAIAGGTTTIIDFVKPRKDQSLIEAYHKRRQAADGNVCCDYALHCIVPHCDEKVMQEMAELATDKYGINSFKFFMVNDFQLNDSDLYLLMEQCRKIGALAQVHAENGVIIEANLKKLLKAGITGPEGHELSRPEDVEAEAVTRAAMIANQSHCPLYVNHVMSKSAAEAVALARSHGMVIFGETLGAALGADGQAYEHESWEHAAGHILSPPLRPEPDTPEALLKFLASFQLQLTASNHCAFSLKQKAAAGKDNFTLIPNGVNGIEERMSVVWEKGVNPGFIDLPRFVAITSTNAAKIFNLYPKKGVIAVGSDADIVVWNPNAVRAISAKNHHSSSDFNIFEGMEIHGGPEYVIVNGKICVEKFELKEIQGHGKFIPRKPWCPFIYDVVKQKEEKLKSRNINLTPLKLSLPEIPELFIPFINVHHLDGSHNERNFSEYDFISHHSTSKPLRTTGRQLRPENQRDQQLTSFSVFEETPEWVRPKE